MSKEAALQYVAKTPSLNLLRPEQHIHVPMFRTFFSQKIIGVAHFWIMSLLFVFKNDCIWGSFV